MRLLSYINSLNCSSESSPSEKPRRGRKRKFLLKLGVSATLLAVIFSRLDRAAWWENLRRVPWQTIVALIALYTLGQMLSAVKWNIFVRGVGITRSSRQTIAAYFLGMFVNSFGLGTIGGDVTRALALRPEPGKRAASLATVIADRVHGLAVLTVIGIVAIAIVRPPEVNSTFVVIGLVGLFAAIVGWLVGPSLLLRVFPSSHRYGETAIRVAGAFPRRLPALAYATLLSAIQHLLQILMHVLMAASLGANLSLGKIFALTPIVNITSSFPISINGLGVREAMYDLLLTPAGVPRATAVSFGAVWFVTVTAVSAIGSLIFAPAAADIESESDETTETMDPPASGDVSLAPSRKTARG